MRAAGGAVTLTDRDLVLVVRVEDPAAAAALAAAYLPVRGTSGEVVTFAPDPGTGTVRISYATEQGPPRTWTVPLTRFGSAVAGWRRQPAADPGPAAAWRPMASRSGR